MEVNADTAAEAARILKAFPAPFDPDEIKVKPAKVSNNRCLALHYIDARLVMDRLDETVGVGGWQDAYTVLPTGEVECRLSVKIAGAWVCKADVGGQSEQPDEGDRMKAAYSDALKRAAVKFGIGRFLYRMAQTWMDYDPVKKQVIRPGSKTPAPAKTLKEQALDAVRAAGGRERCVEIYRQAKADGEKGLMPAADAEDVMRAATAKGQTFPRPADAPKK